MKVKSKIVSRYEDKGRLKAVATVCLDGKFLVTGVRVADCQKGLAVFMPSREIHAGGVPGYLFPHHFGAVQADQGQRAGCICKAGG